MADKEKRKFNPWRPVFPRASGGPNIPINTSIRSSPSPPLTGNHKTMNNAIATAERETNEVIEFFKTINKENIRTQEISDIIMTVTFQDKIKRIMNYLKAKRDYDRIQELETLTAQIASLLDKPASEGGRRRSYRRKHKRTRKTRRIRTRKN